MKRLYVTAAIATVTALSGCKTTPDPVDPGPNARALTALIDQGVEVETEIAQQDTAEKIAAKVQGAIENADEAKLAGAKDSELVWRSVAVNGLDAAAKLSGSNTESVIGYRTQLLGEAAALQTLCEANSTDARLGNRCALGQSIRLMNQSEIALAGFEAAVTGGDYYKAAESADMYMASMSTDWPAYPAAVADLPLIEQDATPVAAQQTASACKLNEIANSPPAGGMDGPIWWNLTLDAAVDGNEAADAAAAAYLSAAATAAQFVGAMPAGGMNCDGAVDDLASTCRRALADGLTQYCEQQSNS